MSVNREQSLRGALRLGADEVQFLAYVLQAIAAPTPDASRVPPAELPEHIDGQSAEVLDQAVGYVSEAVPKLLAASRLLMIRTAGVPDTPEWRALDYDVRRLIAEHAPRERRAG